MRSPAASFVGIFGLFLLFDAQARTLAGRRTAGIFDRLSALASRGRDARIHRTNTHAELEQLYVRQHPGRCRSLLLHGRRTADGVNQGYSDSCCLKDVEGAWPWLARRSQNGVRAEDGMRSQRRDRPAEQSGRRSASSPSGQPIIDFVIQTTGSYEELERGLANKMQAEHGREGPGIRGPMPTTTSSSTNPSCAINVEPQQGRRHRRAASTTVGRTLETMLGKPRGHPLQEAATSSTTWSLKIEDVDRRNPEHLTDHLRAQQATAQMIPLESLASVMTEIGHGRASSTTSTSCARRPSAPAWRRLFPGPGAGMDGEGARRSRARGAIRPRRAVARIPRVVQRLRADAAAGAGFIYLVLSAQFESSSTRW